MGVDLLDKPIELNLKIHDKHAASVNNLTTGQKENESIGYSPEHDSTESHELNCLFKINLVDKKQSSELPKKNEFDDDKLFDVSTISIKEETSCNVSENRVHRSISEARIFQSDKQDSAESVNASKQLSLPLNFPVDSVSMINLVGAPSAISMTSLYSFHDSVGNPIVQDNLSTPDINYIEEQSENKLLILNTLNNHDDVISTAHTSIGNEVIIYGIDSSVNVNENMEAGVPVHNDTTPFMLYENITQAAVTITICFFVVISVVAVIIVATILF